MIVCTIHRNQHDNNWVVLIRDTTRETMTQQVRETLEEAEALCQELGASKTKVHLR